MVDQLADLFRTTHKVKTQQVVKNRGQHCGEIELVGYLANEAGPVPYLVNEAGPVPQISRLMSRRWWLLSLLGS
jgi:hypothetical protein